MNSLLALACLFGVAVAAPYYYGPESGDYIYHGKYGGKCAYNGLYYRDEKSFIFCSNGNKYVQDCAPGSRNSGYGSFSYGKKYSSRDFCDVNLVDSGYGAAEAPKAEAPKAEAPKAEAPKAEEPKAPSYEENYIYKGKYEGKCGEDGLYYKDESSFVFCSNGEYYVQPCAPGSRNSGYKKFSYGGKYSSRDFCDVNLVDGGYASHDGYGYEYVKPSYVAPKYVAPVYVAPKYVAPVYVAPKYVAPVEEEPKEEEEKPEYGYSYYGKYSGKCGKDGLYYKDSASFVFCVDGQDYVQPCAPGSRNSGYGKFSYGKQYSQRDFCDVNLVDSGYNV